MRRLAPVVAVVTAVGLALLPAVSAGAASRLQPRPDEWWFSTWKIQQRVWPLSEGSGATVAVLDTGVQAGVPDLAGAVLPGGNVAGGGGDGRTDVDTQTDGHGTAMSVLIAGRGGGTGMVGIAPRARILPVVVNHNGSAGLTISAGIRFAVDHGAKVISISQGVPGAPGPICDVGVQQAVAYAVEHDVVVVASAGDTGNTASDYPQWPASCAGVLAVGGIEPDGSPWSGTQRQPYVDVAGPGDRVGWSGKDGKYIADSYGTSGAAALVSAALALVRHPPRAGCQHLPGRGDRAEPALRRLRPVAGVVRRQAERAGRPVGIAVEPGRRWIFWLIRGRQWDPDRDHRGVRCGRDSHGYRALRGAPRTQSPPCDSRRPALPRTSLPGSAPPGHAAISGAVSRSDTALPRCGPTSGRGTPTRLPTTARAARPRTTTGPGHVPQLVPPRNTIWLIFRSANFGMVTSRIAVGNRMDLAACRFYGG